MAIYCVTQCEGVPKQVLLSHMQARAGFHALSPQCWYVYIHYLPYNCLPLALGACRGCRLAVPSGRWTIATARATFKTASEIVPRFGSKSRDVSLVEGRNFVAAGNSHSVYADS